MTDIQTEFDPPCLEHPDAPHGFNRNASHNEGSYVCECEGWEPPDANIVPLGQKRHDLQALVDCIKSAVFARTGAISVTEAIGALEIAKMEIFQEQ